MLAKQIILARYNQKPEPFKKIEFPSLKDLALEQVAKNFQLYPHLTGLSELIKQKIISKASKSLPVVITYNSISDETYWRQSCDKKWKGTHRTINIIKHSQSYKIAYMENYLEEHLKSIESLEQPNEKEELIIQLRAVSNWIFTLNISQTLCNIDIGIICQYLPCLSNLTIIYGIKTTETNYKKNALGMRLNHAAELAEAISKNCNNLHTLQLPSNLIDDDLLRFILAGINNNISIVELNLSHNKIDDKGAKRIAQYLLQTEILIKLDLSNNLINYEGSRFIGWALRINRSIEMINLSLNQFNDKAGMKFFMDLACNRQVISLNLSGNQLASQSAAKIADYLADSQCTLQELILSNNNFSDSDFETLKVALTKNTSLILFEIFHCQFTKPNLAQELMDIVVSSRLKQNKIPFVSKDEFNFQNLQKEIRKYQHYLGKKELEQKNQQKPETEIQN